MKDTIVTDKARQRWIIFSISFVSFMVSVDTYIVNISLPTIAESFHVSTGEISWIILSYLLAVTGTLLIFGKMGDRYGLKKVFIGGFVVFTLGSLFCGISSNLPSLIVSRAIQGIGGSMLLGMAPALISTYLPEEKRGTAFGLYATFTALGITIGAPLGGFITGYFSWHWIFIINVPIGIAAIAVCMATIPTVAVSLKNDGETFDYPGALLSLLSSILFLYALNTGKERGWTSPVILGCLAGSLVFLILFFLREKTAKHPLLDLSLLKNPAFVYINIASCFAVAFLAGHNFLMPFYLEYMQGLNSQKAGMVILVYSIVYMVASMTSGKISDKVNPRLLCMGGMVLGTITAVTFALFLRTPGLVAVIGFLGFLAVTYAMFIPSSNNLVMRTAPKGKEGVVSGLFRVGIYLCMAIGVCTFETIFASAINGGGGSSPAYDTVSRDVLAKGFMFAYGAGGVSCLFALFSAYMTDTGKTKMEDGNRKVENEEGEEFFVAGEV